MKEILEDTISRNKKFQEERKLRVKRLKELNAPAVILEHEEKIANMTIAEYNVYLKELEDEDKAMDKEYAKHHSIQEQIVDEIYNRVEKLEYESLVYTSNVCFLRKVHPLEFMSKDDFDYNLYQTFLTHAREIYHKKYLTEYTKEFGDEDDEAEDYLKRIKE